MDSNDRLAVREETKTAPQNRVMFGAGGLGCSFSDALYSAIIRDVIPMTQALPDTAISVISRGSDSILNIRGIPAVSRVVPR